MEGSQELFSRRSVLESQEPATLLALRDKKLAELSDLESDIHLINDVLGGYGWEEEMERVVTPTERERLERVLASYGLYDASQDRYEVTEHPEDERWARGYD